MIIGYNGNKKVYSLEFTPEEWKKLINGETQIKRSASAQWDSFEISVAFEGNKVE